MSDKKKSDPRPDWSIIKGLSRTRFADNVREQLDIKSQIGELEAQLSVLKGELVKLLVKADVKTVSFEGRPVTRMDGSSTRLDKKKFYRLGGDAAMEAYEKSLVKTPYTTVLIGKPFDEDAEDED